MLRYRLLGMDRRMKIYADEKFKEFIHQMGPLHQEVFVDILDQNDTSYKLRVFLPDGKIVVGWCLGKIMSYVTIHNEHELYDGRFNSDKVI